MNPVLPRRARYLRSRPATVSHSYAQTDSRGKRDVHVGMSVSTKFCGGISAASIALAMTLRREITSRLCARSPWLSSSRWPAYSAAAHEQRFPLSEAPARRSSYRAKEFALDNSHWSEGLFWRASSNVRSLGEVANGSTRCFSSSDGEAISSLRARTTCCPERQA
jgi:hypothetical protein